MKRLFKRLSNRPLHPDGLAWSVVFGLVRLAFRAGVIRHSKTIPTIATPDANVVLTPLAGSSSARHAAGPRLGLATFERNVPTVMLDRDYAKRLQSFYNKKVRNPTTVGKCALLAMCPPLTPDSTPRDLIRFVSGHPDRRVLDKHLWSIDDILTELALNRDGVVLVSLPQDQERIEAFLGVRLDRRVNATTDVATYREEESFTPEDRAAASAIVAGTA